MKTQTLKESRLLWRVSSNLAVDASIAAMGPSAGYRRLQGQIVLAAGMTPAAGFPRVRWLANATTVMISRALSLDPTQATPVYTFDVPVEGPYVTVEYTNGAAVAGNVSAWAQLVPGGA